MPSHAGRMGKGNAGVRKTSKRAPIKRAKAVRKSWGNADIGDVEEAIEDNKMVEKMRTKGEKGPKAKEGLKADEYDAEGLFSVDVKGSSEGLSAASKREVCRAKSFPAKAAKIGMSASEIAKVDRAETGLADRTRTKAKKADVFDLWGAVPQKVRPTASGAPVGKRVIPAQAPLYKKPRTLYQSVGSAPAVIKPHEGQSMNPDDKAYEDLACRAAAAQLADERNAEELDRKLRPITHELRDLVGAEKLKNMDANEQMALWRELTGKINTEGDDAEGDDAATKKSKGRMKSQAARNKMKKLKGMSSLELQRRQEEQMEKSVGEVGAILKDMKKTARREKKRREYRQTLVDKSKALEKESGVVMKARRLGRTTFRERGMPVPASATAGAKGLRAMPLQGAIGNAVQDRMQSFARRGLLATPFDPGASENHRSHTKNLRAQNRKKKFMSPLLRDNILLR